MVLDLTSPFALPVEALVNWRTDLVRGMVVTHNYSIDGGWLNFQRVRHYFLTLHGIWTQVRISLSIFSENLGLSVVVVQVAHIGSSDLGTATKVK